MIVKSVNTTITIAMKLMTIPSFSPDFNLLLFLKKNLKVLFLQVIPNVFFHKFVV